MYSAVWGKLRIPLVDTRNTTTRLVVRTKSWGRLCVQCLSQRLPTNVSAHLHRGAVPQVKNLSPRTQPASLAALSRGTEPWMKPTRSGHSHSTYLANRTPTG